MTIGNNVMEQALIDALNSGNISSVICAGIVYLIIHYQRKQTGTQRDTDKELMKKDIENLKDRADKTDDHFTRIENQLSEINKSIVRLCTLIESQQKAIEKLQETAKP